ncbi:leucine-rich repeat, immunoglobulin-like domain and transmembrane domain-containing protein 2 [Leptopilina heterotoma]|uniref:leucine-rich repeat, immunoglobulin-like domain and transmembrane domain-containing protein 2 n=1 Tax=Leptopilina heterotoma TaxID=63436 RepID=UPI001CA81692|nr:leucine-rich repeat, immunoglobulin-like domain and transmembrane domain-containing protein 2 [Leptopilina heterotoma]
MTFIFRFSFNSTTMKKIVLLLVSLNISVFIPFTNAICSINDDDGFKSLKCDHSSLDEIESSREKFISNIFITLSKIPQIRDHTFLHFGSIVKSLSLQNCEIVEIATHAFASLNNLQKLSLNNNNISHVYFEWFYDTPNLKELDLSFNKIKNIKSTVFQYLYNLRNLNLNNNQISCLRPDDLKPMKNLEKIRFDGNSLQFTCRGKLTRWLRDRGNQYTSEGDGFKYREDFLDSLIWKCDIDRQIADSELLMKECVFLNLYNQLQTALVTSCSFPSSASECVNERSSLVRCIQESGNGNINNGEAVRKLLLALRSGSKTPRYI